MIIFGIIHIGCKVCKGCVGFYNYNVAIKFLLGFTVLIDDVFQFLFDGNIHALQLIAVGRRNGEIDTVAHFERQGADHPKQRVAVVILRRGGNSIVLGFRFAVVFIFKLGYSKLNFLIFQGMLSVDVHIRFGLLGIFKVHSDLLRHKGAGNWGFVRGFAVRAVCIENTAGLHGLLF